MDFELDDDQRALLDGLDAILRAHAGPERAAEAANSGGHDAKLEAALDDAGFGNVLEAAGPLEAVLAIEAVARAGGLAAFGARALVAPLVVGRSLAGPIALARPGSGELSRYAPVAQTLLMAAGPDAPARLARGEAERIEATRTNYAYAMGRVPEESWDAAEVLAPGSGERLLAWWRVALAAELVGCMRGALDCTVAYLCEREQFGRPIGSFQAVQHRLADCAVAIQGCRWLVLEAAAHDAPREAAATAAGYAAETAAGVFRETHQLSGAIGFTREHALHVWSMRLPVLRLELGGAPAHYAELARVRWGADRP